MRAFAKWLLLSLGRMLALILPWRNGGGTFFFLPFYHVGGAEVVHADILEISRAKRPWIVICLRSESTALKSAYARCGRVIDISALLCNTAAWVIAIGYFSRMVNSSRNPMVFGSNCYFFYELLPFLGPHVHRVDLIHSLDSGLEELCLSRSTHLDRRIVIDPNTYRKMQALYARRGLSPELLERLDLVENKVAIPESPCRSGRTEKLRVCYVGRGTAEKRVHLVGRIAALCHRKGLEVDFTLVGDVADAVAAEDRSHCTFVGQIRGDALAACYRNADLLLLTSSREGFPLVIMEAMAHGVVPVTTDVGGIPHHVHHGVNGFLVGDAADEESIVARFVETIAALQADRNLLDRTSEASCRYAADNFGGRRFYEYYGNLFRGQSCMPGNPQRPDGTGGAGTDGSIHEP